MSKYSLERIAPANSIGMRFTTVYGPNARESMLIPRILRNDVPYINTNHSRDFIHINDLVRAIDTLIKSDFKGITDIGSGVTNNLVELVDYFGIDCERAVGEENERLDNLADNTILNKIGWSPNIKLYDYIKEKRNASN
jgi:nucleoside-diphosphate-sugar epimerase